MKTKHLKAAGAAVSLLIASGPALASVLWSRVSAGARLARRGVGSRSRIGPNTDMQSVAHEAASTEGSKIGSVVSSGEATPAQGSIRMISVAVVLACLAVVNAANALCIEGATTSCSIGGQEGIKECIGGHWGPCEIAPDPEPPALAPYPPQGLAATERKDTSIKLQRYDQATNEQGYEVLRSDFGRHGPWVRLAAVSAQAGQGSPMNYTDTGLLPDTVYCYWVTVFNDHGAANSPQSCVYTRYTRDGNDYYSVWRAQIVLHTADREDANTDDAVSVYLNGDASAAPIGNGAGLDYYARNDFERGDTFTYDLDLDTLDDVGDITQIAVRKEGQDGWCLADFTLQVNGLPVYSQAFSDLPEGCLWLDTDVGESTSYIVSHAMLRAHPAWAAYNHLAATALLVGTGLPNAELVSRLEALTGDRPPGHRTVLGPSLWRGRRGDARLSGEHSAVPDDSCGSGFSLPRSQSAGSGSRCRL